ncbi:ABC-2 family transporter protein [Thalassoglobus neptunius]|uniref:ABC-2 family transporter protein n=1 Tax=Thalassoglobus neptunius TaxID=1938619 RepID=A0A5C5WAF2_9PLAN|nr:ABC transporter permease subunit [Thalassoglobus neptunius]TWT47039.1 ABC-2 family transporter protein [Thalassoglobus neptunius]
MNNPVVERELMTTFRSPRSIILMLAPAFVTSLLVVLQWPTDAVVSESGRRAQEVFSIFGYGLGALVCLLTPVTPAVSIVRERLKGTLNLLFHTPLGRLTIYIGKLVGAVALFILFLMMTLPAAGACYAMGGMTMTGDLIPLYLVLIVAGIQISALALAVSSYNKNIDSAVRTSYALTLLLVVGTMGPYQVLQGSENRLLAIGADWLRHASPLPALSEVLGHGDVAGQGIVSHANSVWRYIIVAGVSTLAFAALTIRRLSVSIFDESRDSGVMTDDLELSQRMSRRVFFLVDPQKRSAGIADWSNPVLAKEFRSRKFGRATWMLRLIAVCAVASIALTYFAATGVEDWSVEMIGGLLVILQMALIVLLAPGMSAGLLAGEIESGGWTMLRITPQSSMAIVIGKLLSVSWTMGMILLATLPGYLVMIYVKPILQQQILLVIGSLVLSSIFTVITSAAIGSFFRKSTPATLTSYCILTAITALPILIWLGRDAPFGFRTVETALIMNPMSSALALMETRGFEPYSIVPWNWYFLITGCIIGLVIFWRRVEECQKPD